MNTRILKIIGITIILQFLTPAVMSDEEICWTEDEILEFANEFHDAQIKAMKDNGIIFTTEEKLTKFIDEEVARALKSSSGDGKEYIQEGMKDMVPYMNNDQKADAYCAGHLRYEDMQWKEHEKQVMTRKLLDEYCEINKL